MSDTAFEDDRKPAAVENREPRDVEKGEDGGGGVKLPSSATKTQSKRAQSSFSRYKRSHKHSHKHKQHHRDKSSQNNWTTNDGDDEKIADTDHRGAPYASTASNRRPAELVSLADDTKPPYKPSKTTRRMEEVDNQSIAKPRETLAYAPSLVARRPADAAVPKVPDENVDKELPATAFGQFNLPQPTTTTTTIRPTIASAANENVANSNQARTNAIMTPRDLVPNAPGAFAVNGPNDVLGGQDDDDNFTYSAQDDRNVDNNIHAAPANPANPVEARLVDNSDDVENLQEQLRRQQQELEQMRRNQENIVVGQVVGVDNNDDEPNDEEERPNNDNTTTPNNNKSIFGLKRKVAIVGVIAVLAIIAIIVGVAVAASSNSQQNASESQSSPTVESSPVEPQTVAPTQSPTAPPTLPPTAAPTSTTQSPTPLCDQSSSSLAKRLPCYSQNTTVLDLSSNSLTSMIPSQIALLSNLAGLSLYNNSLRGTIPSQIALMSNLDYLDLSNNNFTGEFTCPAFIYECYISCDDYNNDTCRSL